jgi:hypothetical protein
MVGVLGSGEAEDVLRGTTLEVYRFLLKSSKPVGAREVQRTLHLSTPSLATYHLSKLEETGFVRKEKGEFIVNKVILEDCIRFGRFLIPRYLFYSVFAVLALMVELVFFRPTVITSQYFFFVTVTFVCALTFCFETVKIWAKGGL